MVHERVVGVASEKAVVEEQLEPQRFSVVNQEGLEEGAKVLVVDLRNNQLVVLEISGVFEQVLAVDQPVKDAAQAPQVDVGDDGDVRVLLIVLVDERVLEQQVVCRVICEQLFRGSDAVEVERVVEVGHFDDTFKVDHDVVEVEVAVDPVALVGQEHEAREDLCGDDGHHLLAGGLEIRVEELVQREQDGLEDYQVGFFGYV